MHGLHRRSGIPNVQVIRLQLNEGANAHARGGKYGTALQAVLAPDFVNWTWRTRDPTSVFSLVELLLDHGADITAYVPESEYGDALTAAKQLWKHDSDRLGALIELLASRGQKGDLSLRKRKGDFESQGWEGDEPGSNEDLEDSQKPKRRLIG